MGELTDPFSELAVGEFLQVPVNDFLVRGVNQRGSEQVFDEQGIGIGAGGRRKNFGLHVCSLG
ncbi:MAG: hypothetical protein ACD_75C01779G0003 [uncultured bacterium]|nr:MAG: hypothetical protein ACD_75C01779G0003 [uncultured bacterium]